MKRRRSRRIIACFLSNEDCVLATTSKRRYLYINWKRNALTGEIIFKGLWEGDFDVNEMGNSCFLISIGENDLFVFDTQPIRDHELMLSRSVLSLFD